MLRKILRLFPSGIMFYNQVDGILYKNKFWIDLVARFKNSHDLHFWNPKGRKISDIDKLKDKPNLNDTTDSNEDNIETEIILEAMLLRDHKFYTLKDEIIKIYHHLFSSKPIEQKSIDE